MEIAMEIKEVGQRIAKLRKENGWSQMELSEKLNVSDKTVSKWENGGMPGIDLFPKMAKLFNVSIDYLMTGNEEDVAHTGDSQEGEDAQDLATDNVTDREVKSEELPKRTEEKKVKVNLPENYVCPKCGKVNPHPDTHCAFCYHKFVIMEENDTDLEDENVVTPEDTSTPIVCPKCNRVNSNRGTHCMYCYHDFSKNTTLQKANMNKRGGAQQKNYFSKYSGNQSYGASATTNQRPAATNQAGCLAYLLAFLFPLIALIWGAVKHERGITIFSGVLLALRFVSVIIYFLVGLLLLGV